MTTKKRVNSDDSIATSKKPRIAPKKKEKDFFEDEVECSICNEWFFTFREYLVHRKSIHPHEHYISAPVRCEVCGIYRFYDKSSLMRHLKTCPLPSNSESDYSDPLVAVQPGSDLKDPVPSPSDAPGEDYLKQFDKERIVNCSECSELIPYSQILMHMKKAHPMKHYQDAQLICSCEKVRCYTFEIFNAHKDRCMNGDHLAFHDSPEVAIKPFSQVIHKRSQKMNVPTVSRANEVVNVRLLNPLPGVVKEENENEEKPGTSDSDVVYRNLREDVKEEVKDEIVDHGYPQDSFSLYSTPIIPVIPMNKTVEMSAYPKEWLEESTSSHDVPGTSKRIPCGKYIEDSLDGRTFTNEDERLMVLEGIDPTIVTYHEQHRTHSTNHRVYRLPYQSDSFTFTYDYLDVKTVDYIMDNFQLRTVFAIKIDFLLFLHDPERELQWDARSNWDKKMWLRKLFHVRFDGKKERENERNAWMTCVQAINRRTLERMFEEKNQLPPPPSFTPPELLVRYSFIKKTEIDSLQRASTSTENFIRSVERILFGRESDRLEKWENRINIRKKQWLKNLAIARFGSGVNEADMKMWEKCVKCINEGTQEKEQQGLFIYTYLDRERIEFYKRSCKNIQSFVTTIDEILFRNEPDCFEPWAARKNADKKAWLRELILHLNPTDDEKASDLLLKMCFKTITERTDALKKKIKNRPRRSVPYYVNFSFLAEHIIDNQYGMARTPEHFARLVDELLFWGELDRKEPLEMRANEEKKRFLKDVVLSYCGSGKEDQDDLFWRRCISLIDSKRGTGKIYEDHPDVRTPLAMAEYEPVEYTFVKKANVEYLLRQSYNYELFARRLDTVLFKDEEDHLSLVKIRKNTEKTEWLKKVILMHCGSGVVHEDELFLKRCIQSINDLNSGRWKRMKGKEQREKKQIEESRSGTVEYETEVKKEPEYNHEYGTTSSLA